MHWGSLTVDRMSNDEQVLDTSRELVGYLNIDKVLDNAITVNAVYLSSSLRV